MPRVAFWKPALDFGWHEAQCAPGPQDREQQLHHPITAYTPWQLLGIYQATLSHRSFINRRSQCLQMALHFHTRQLNSSKITIYRQVQIFRDPPETKSRTLWVNLKYTHANTYVRLIMAFTSRWGTILSVPILKTDPEVTDTPFPFQKGKTRVQPYTRSQRDPKNCGMRRKQLSQPCARTSAESHVKLFSHIPEIKALEHSVQRLQPTDRNW